MSALKNGALYIRVSTADQTELSPDAQQRLLLDYAKKNGIVIAKEFIFEESVSGRHADRRPKFQEMIALAKQDSHPIDVILVWKYSRFARNQEESIVYKSLLKKSNVDVISISEPLIDGPFGTLIERIIEWMDEYYSIRLSGEVMRGMKEKALNHLAVRESRVKMAFENGIDTLEEYGANKKRLAEERQSLQEELDRVLTPAAPPETISKEDFRKEIKNINDILKNPEEPAEKKGLLLRSIVDRIVYEKASGTMYFDFFVS